jgi:hypothetical protein
MKPVYAYDKPNKLYRVKKIFIEEVYLKETGERIETFLRKELIKAGFVVVDEASSADAILRGEVKAEVTLDGDGSIPNKSIYEYQLVLMNKEIVWKSTIKFVSKSTFTEDHEFAAKKMAEKILSDWKKSLRQAQ